MFATQTRPLVLWSEALGSPRVSYDESAPNAECREGTSCPNFFWQSESVSTGTDGSFQRPRSSSVKKRKLQPVVADIKPCFARGWALVVTYGVRGNRMDKSHDLDLCPMHRSA